MRQLVYFFFEQHFYSHNCKISLGWASVSFVVFISDYDDARSGGRTVLF